VIRLQRKGVGGRTGGGGRLQRNGVERMCGGDVHKESGLGGREGARVGETFTEERG